MPSAPDAGSTSVLDVVRMLRAAGAVLVSQAGLHGQLLQLEWEAEKSRIIGMLVAVAVIVIGLFCALLTLGALVLVFTWDTRYRIPATIAVLLAYAGTAAFAWYRLRVLSARGRDAFSASREELSADLELLKSRL